MSSAQFWNDRYENAEVFAYGTEPNDFLKASIDSKTINLPQGASCLCLAEGEGRNAVFLAKQGFNVVAVDNAEAGARKTEHLAQRNRVKVQTIVADLADLEYGKSRYDFIVGIFCHVPPPIRQRMLDEIPKALKPKGYVLFECYTPDQLKYNTGGPPSPEPMFSAKLLEESMGMQLEIRRNEELVRDVVEGEYHTGEGAVVQFIGQKRP